jgi:hypothetical protein
MFDFVILAIQSVKLAKGCGTDMQIPREIKNRSH